KTEGCYRKALTSGARTFGPGAPELMPLLDKLGVVCSAQSKFRDADNCLTQVVALYEKHYGATDTHAVDARQRLYTVLQAESTQYKHDNQPELAAALEKRMAALQPPAPAVSVPAASTPVAPPTTPVESMPPAA